MGRRTPGSKASASAGAIEKLLEDHYEQLLKWGELLARGDAGTAREIVHDLCLYLALTKPDFSGVANLDGYLYTSLRHIYLSWIARSSREALRFVSIGDFDSIQFAFAGTQPGGSVDLQNDLRNICSYSVWRKDSSKSFSYFILHFFHGYFPREIAEIACVPVSAIYNKLKAARTEVRSYLASPNKLRSIDQGTPPVPVLALTAVSSAELFEKLRDDILQARRSGCLPEEELLAHYRVSHPSPLSRLVLSHIVSCERCLALVDGYFGRPTLKDRDSLDGFDRALNRKSVGDEGARNSNSKAKVESVLRRSERVYQHRPGTLSIAIGGKIVAFHDVQGERSGLSARIERAEDAQFVEVFSGQDIRLALLSVGDLTSDPHHILGQHVRLSDGRWLELNLAFDGLALQSEVVYFDPALAANSQEDAEEAWSASASEHSAAGLRSDPRPAHAFARPGLITRLLRGLRPSPTLAWVIAIAFVLCGSGYLVHRYTRPTLDANAVLNRSVRVEASILQGNTEHQVLRLVETSSGGGTLKGTVDLWRDGDDGRYMRRLYDDQHHLIAAEWRSQGGRSGSFVVGGNTGVSDADRQLAANELWKQDLSSRAFRALAGHRMRISAKDGGYRLSAPVSTDSGVHLISAVLVLDRNFNPVSEVLRVRSDSGIREVRLVQTKWDHQPSSTVPDAVFAPGSMNSGSSEGHGVPSSAVGRDNAQNMAGAEVQLVQLEIAALYQLNQMNADVGEPIDIAKTPDGHIRVDGTVSDDGLKAEVISRLEALPDRQFLRIRLRSQNDVRIPASGAPQPLSPTTGVYNVTQTEAPADTILSSYFATKGLTGDPAKTAAMQFSQDALEHAQRALQHAYALDRLGNSFTTEQLRSVNPIFQRQWTEMMARHASALEIEFRALHDELATIAPGDGESPASEADSIPIDTPATFAHAADQMLHQTQNLDRAIGSAFASGVLKKADMDPKSLVTNAARSIPLREAMQMVAFAARFAGLQGIQDAPDTSPGQQAHRHMR